MSEYVLEDGNLFKTLLDKKVIIEKDGYYYLDKEVASPETWKLEQEDSNDVYFKDNERYELVSPRGYNNNILYCYKDIDVNYLTKPIPDSVITRFRSLREDFVRYKNGLECHPDTEVLVYGKLEYVHPSAIMKDGDNVNVDMYLGFSADISLDEIKHCSITLPKDNMFEINNGEAYGFYLTEPEYEVANLDKNGDKFKVESKYLDFYNTIGESVYSEVIDRQQRRENQVESLSKTLDCDKSSGYELE